MTATISATDVARPAAGTHCRVSERFSCDVAVSCQPPSAWRGGRDWPARIRDVSSGGLRLLLRRRFEPGTGLAVEVAGAEDDAPSTLLVRVVRVRAEADGCWLLGCTFVSPLGEEEIQGLLQPGSPAAAETPAARPFVADIALRGKLVGGGVIRRLIRKLYVPAPPWPLPAGLVIGLRFRPFSDDPPVQARVDACRTADERRVLECTFLGEAPAGLTPREVVGAARPGAAVDRHS